MKISSYGLLHGVVIAGVCLFVCLFITGVVIFCLSPTGKYSNMLVTEEEYCEDLVLFIRMLTNLTTKDYLDFSQQQGGVGCLLHGCL